MKKYKPYIYNYLILSFILLSIAYIRGFIPFGSRSMLTVDLGQQYIDFFSLFKETLTKDLRLFLYSFQKGFGGEMIGLWAYYLMSPFNLILLLFPQEKLALAVSLLTYLKFVACSLSMMVFIRKKYTQDLVISLSMSLSYALMSYMVVFMLNIMWLDGVIILPLIALTLDRLFKEGKGLAYSLSLAYILIANYYIAYMICLFLIIYAFFLIIEKEDKLEWRTVVKDYLYFVAYSLLAALMSAWLLVPTFLSLLNSKANEAEALFTLDSSYNLLDIASKLFIGSFNFDELSSGSPNLYVGMAMCFFLLMYFFSRPIKRSEKIMSLGILAFFALSFYFNLLDKIWHGGQYPIWFHYRFSFTLSFFVLSLMTKGWAEAHYQLGMRKILGISLMLTALAFYCHFSQAYEFLSREKLLLSLVFVTLYALALYFPFRQDKQQKWVLLAIILADLSANALLITQEMSYVQHSKFLDYVTILDQSIEPLKADSDDFYRIHTNYQRTKNEAFFVHYNGLNHFGSTIEANVPPLYGYLGLPHGGGFINYTNGTLFTDDFFNIRYLNHPTPDSRDYTADDEYVLYPEATTFDIFHYPLIKHMDRFDTYENEERFGLGIEVSPEILQAHFQSHQPIRNQNLLINLINYDAADYNYFEPVEFTSVDLDRLNIIDDGDGDFFKYEIDPEAEEGSVDYHFTTDEGLYYLTIPSQIKADNADLTLNGNDYYFYRPFRDRQVLNASFLNEQADQVFSIIIKEDHTQLNPAYLYRFDLEAYEQMVHEKQDQLFQVTNFKQNQIQGVIDIQQEEAVLLFTIPYDKNWQIKVDGQDAKPIAVLNNTLLAIQLTEGFHQIELHYFPIALIYGIMTSIVGILIALWIRFRSQGQKEVYFEHTEINY